MPTLGTERIQVMPEKCSGGSKFSFRTEISVNREGWFTFTIPEELEETAKANARKMKDVSVGKMRVNNYIMTRTKSEGIEFLRIAAQDYVNCEVTRETVILYTTRANVTYWKKADGTIVPNGAYDREYQKNKGKWHGKASTELAMDIDHTYSVGLRAHVYVKVTAHRKSGDQIAWERAGENCHTEPDNYLDKLNSFIGGMPDYGREEFSEIPYTEEAAKFFYEAMLSICKLSDRIESFFGNPENVQKAIESRSSFMLGAGK